MTEGKCVSCSHLKTQIETGTRIKSESTIGYLMDTCDPTNHGPNPIPARHSSEKNTTKEVRYLRWLLESSFVFEGKKAGDDCSASLELSKARAYVDILMKKHFGKRKEDGNVVALTLTTPGGIEGTAEKSAYEAARVDVSDKHRKWFQGKLEAIGGRRYIFFEVYCSREEGLVCVGDIKNKCKCRECGVWEWRGEGEC
jgi:hypothetical protein